MYFIVQLFITALARDAYIIIIHILQNHYYYLLLINCIGVW